MTSQRNRPFGASVGGNFFFSSRRRHTRCSRDWSSDVCSSDLTTATVGTGGAQGFMATVQNDTQNSGVTWSLSGTGCTGASCGTATGDPSANNAVNYAAPAGVPNPPTVILTATSVADPTKSASATITIVQPTPPSISSLNPTAGPPGSSVTITGTNFGLAQGTSTVTFNGTLATLFTSWGPTGIGAIIPPGATPGNVVVTVGGMASNGVAFTVTPPPSITSVSPSSGPVGSAVTIAGASFCATQGASTVTLHGARG